MTRHVCRNVEDMCDACQTLAENMAEPEADPLGWYADRNADRYEAELDRRWGE